jgi:hypothetical protein
MPRPVPPNHWLLIPRSDRSFSLFFTPLRSLSLLFAPLRSIVNAGCFSERGKRERGRARVGKAKFGCPCVLFPLALD